MVADDQIDRKLLWVKKSIFEQVFYTRVLLFFQGPYVVFSAYPWSWYRAVALDDLRIEDGRCDQGAGRTHRYAYKQA